MVEMAKTQSLPRAQIDVACDLQLHFAGALPGIPVEGTADREGSARAPGIHDTRIYTAFRRCEAHGCLDAIFEGSVFKRHQDGRLDSSIIHGDGTTTAAKKGGRQPRLQAPKRSAKLAASMNAQDTYLLPFLMLPSPFFLPLLMCWLSTQHA